MAPETTEDVGSSPKGAIKLKLKIGTETLGTKKYKLAHLSLRAPNKLFCLLNFQPAFMLIKVGEHFVRVSECQTAWIWMRCYSVSHSDLSCLHTVSLISKPLANTFSNFSGETFVCHTLSKISETSPNLDLLLSISYNVS